MDRVRLGRVLGRGARLAVRTAYEALDAANSPAPKEGGGTASTSATRLANAERIPPRRVHAIAEVAPADRRQTRTASSQSAAGIFTPFRKASRAVTLEVTGSFFALFAFSFSLGVWRERGELHAGAHGIARFGAFCAIALFFAYFSISSFVRARRVR